MYHGRILREGMILFSGKLYRPKELPHFLHYFLWTRYTFYLTVLNLFVLILGNCILRITLLCEVGLTT